MLGSPARLGPRAQGGAKARQARTKRKPRLGYREGGRGERGEEFLS